MSVYAVDRQGLEGVRAQILHDNAKRKIEISATVSEAVANAI